MPLFIGGINDGEWLDFKKPYPSVFRIGLPSKLIERNHQGEPVVLNLPEFRYEEYKCIPLREKGIEYPVYVVSELKGESIVRLLLEGYRRKAK
jgi:hypothetical protein